VTEPSYTTGEFPMPGHPGVPEGLRAYAQPTHPDGTFDHDRAGRPKVRRVHLRAHPPSPPQRPAGLVNDADWNWATSAPRRWNTITTKLHDRADDAALALARAGCVALEHDYRSGTICHPPRGWIPHPDLADHHATGKQTRQAADKTSSTVPENSARSSSVNGQGSPQP
jgi:serine/threonine-protein kinase